MEITDSKGIRDRLDIVVTGYRVAKPLPESRVQKLEAVQEIQ